MLPQDSLIPKYFREVRFLSYRTRQPGFYFQPDFWLLTSRRIHNLVNPTGNHSLIFLVAIMNEVNCFESNFQRSSKVVELLIGTHRCDVKWFSVRPSCIMEFRLILSREWNVSANKKGC